MTIAQSDEVAAKLRYTIDAMWCDVQGVYVRGWAYCDDEPVTALHLRCGDLVAAVEDRHARPDVQAAFPAARVGDCGFTCYLACPPFKPVWLGISTHRGTTEFELVAVVQPDAASVAPDEDFFERFVARMKEVRGSVVEIGARAVSPGATLKGERFSPECTFTGVDIHAAPGVDVVADAHFLSSVIPPGTVDGVFSLAVLEHLAAPWLVAAEINRVLKIGGLTYHIVPHSWPVHEMPNDFWRMSHEGLKVIFGAGTGFEVVEAGMSMPVQMTTHAALRHPPYLEFPLSPGMGASHIIARKVADLAPDAVRWPAARNAVEHQSRTYPWRNADAP
jgi:hypothetical protein